MTPSQTWPSLIWLEMAGPTHLTDMGHWLAFETDQKSQRQTWWTYQLLVRTAPADCIEVVFTGLFETERDWSRRLRPHPELQEMYYGFGHVGAAPAQLYLKTGDGIALVPHCMVRLLQ